MNRAFLTALVVTASAAGLTGCSAKMGAPPAGAANWDASEAAPPGDSEGEAQQPAPTPAAPPQATYDTASGGVAAKPSAPRSEDPFELAQPKSRPGLATSWGEARQSRVSSAPFARADRTTPFALGKLFYNDPEGIAAMSDSHPGSRRETHRFALGLGHLELGLRDGSGNFLTGFEMGGNDYITGIAGRRYTIIIKNHSPGRIEAVVSVDGLDVIDGQPAAVEKRGYLIDPFSDLEIEGFRTSTSEVAAFRFGSVSQSYANKKHGETRNVGVIGVALFHEQGDSPRAWGSPRSHEDVTTRHGADPFPKNYASPP